MKTRKYLKKWAAILLCAALLAGAGSMGAAAEGPQRPDDLTYKLYDIADWAARGLLKGVALLFPPIGIPCEMPESVNFYEGTAPFAAMPATPSYTWQLGHAKASGTEGLSDEFISKLFVTGTLDIIGKRKVTEIKDPPMAYVTALSDGVNGTAVFVSLDAFGITSYDVGNIRAALKDFAEDKDIRSINVSALHQHSTVDTLGMNGNVVAAVFLNSFAQLTKLYPVYSGKNKEYMKHLTEVVADTVEEAVGNMEPGELRYGKVDIEEYINEKRAPDCFDKYFHRLRFVPTATGSKETWLANAPIHTTGVGIGGTVVTSDWPYYIAKNLENYGTNGTNFQFIQGAQLAMGIRFDEDMPGADGHQRMARYGQLLADRLKSIGDTDEALPALLNIAHKEYILPVDNPLHLLFFRLGVIDSSGYKKDLLGLKLELKTELGYMELGGKVAVAMVPGEMEPALAFDGNGLAKELSYRREEYKFKPMIEMLDSSIEHFMVFGLTNDQVGYMVLPNDIAHFVAFGNEEVNMSSSQVAPLTLAAFKALTESVR